MTGLVCVTCVQDQADAAAARLLRMSLREFGGAPYALGFRSVVMGICS
jgi:hypothetical protein